MIVSEVSSSVTLGADGIWRAPRTETVSYPDDGHDKCAEVEDASFWFRHRNRCIVAALQRHPPAGALFDIGGGNGVVAAALIANGFDAVLVEPGARGALNAKRRGVGCVICATTETAEFNDLSLPAIGLFDVIEHIEDHTQFANRMHQLLVPKGHLYLTVPAYPALWSHEDVAAGHARRHTRASITGLLRRSGFEIDYATYFFRPLPVPVLLRRALPYRLGLVSAVATDAVMARDHAVRGGLLTSVLDRLLACEAQNIRLGRPMSFGASCLVVAHKTS